MRKGFSFRLLFAAETRLYLLPFILFSSLLTASCGGGDSSGGSQAVEVTAVKIEPMTVPYEMEYTGQTESPRKVEIRARVEGYLEKRQYDEGSMVKAGDILFRIDSKPFKAALEREKGVMAQQKALNDNARRTYARVKPLAAENAASQKDLDDAVSNMESTDAAVKSAAAKVREEELNLSYTTVKAPIPGLVGRALLPEGSFVSPNVNGLLTTLYQIDPMYVVFNISENELLKLRSEIDQKTLIMPKGENLDVELILADGKPYPVMGKLNFAEPTFSLETGTMRIRAEFPNTEKMLLPGQFVKIRLKGAMKPNAIIVPQKAVFQGQKGKFVYVVGKENKAEIRNVTAGEWQSGQMWLISSGLNTGDTLVVDGAMKLAPGAPVKIVADTPGERNATDKAGRDQANATTKKQ